MRIVASKILGKLHHNHAVLLIFEQKQNKKTLIALNVSVHTHTHTHTTQVNPVKKNFASLVRCVWATHVISRIRCITKTIAGHYDFAFDGYYRTKVQLF